MLDLVTGSAGFIGSNLTDSLLANGRSVIGIDNLSRNYDPNQKIRNLRSATTSANFDFRHADILDVDLSSELKQVDTVYHLAGQPGVQTSWGSGFESHLTKNVLATQKILEECLSAGVRRVVISSSSSVYGSANGESKETDMPRPVSPYGVTKLAAENLALVYAERGLDVACLRLFTVYGPRQRPDMSIHRMLVAALKGEPFPLWGGGLKRRSFTFVEDIVEALKSASQTDKIDQRILNAGGTEPIKIIDLVDIVENIVGSSVPLQEVGERPGDPDLTCASPKLVLAQLGWSPKTSLEDGLAAQLEWHKSIINSSESLQEVG